jgi:WD40 repeat protein
VAYNGKDRKHVNLRRLVLYNKSTKVAELALGRPGCHTVHYNNAAQVLIPIGYRISIPVYSVHPDYFDFTLVAELVGHSSLVTCVCDIENSSMICTGDDVGCIRVWDLRMMRCIQVVKAARWLGHLLYIPDEKLIFTDSRVNMMNF